MSSSIMLMSLWACERKGKGGETEEEGREGRPYSSVRPPFKHHMETISIYSMYVDQFRIKGSSSRSANMLG